MALDNRIAGVIFDYGGVLVKHQTPSDQAHLAALAGLPADRFLELYWTDRLDYDRGILSAVDYWQHIGRQAGLVFTLPQIQSLVDFDAQAWMNFDEVMFDWVRNLRASGKRTAVLSNMPRDLGEALKTKTDRFKLFDHVTLSYELNAVKPEPVIYEDCLRGLGVTPEQALFLDDRIENVRGAEMLGMRAVQFTSAVALFEGLNTP